MAITICWQEKAVVKQTGEELDNLVDRWERYETAEAARDQLLALHKTGISLEDVLLFEHQAESDPEYFLNSFGIYLEGDE